MKKFILSIIAVAAIACGLSSCGNNIKPSFKNGEYDSVAYAYGVLFGTQYSNFSDTGAVTGPGTDVVMSLDNFLAGFIPAIRRDSNNVSLTPEEAQELIQNFQMKLRQQMEEKRQAEINENKTKGADYMAQNAQKEGVIVTESGLQIQMITEGTGAQPKEGDEVLVNYKGSLVDGSEFDANDSVKFSTNGVVKGFKEGILALKEGGKAIITMPSDLGYGDRAMGEKIPAGSTLVFEVELLKVVK